MERVFDFSYMNHFGSAGRLAKGITDTLAVYVLALSY